MAIKHLNKCTFKHSRTIAHSRRKHWNTRLTQKFLDSSCDNEQNDIHVLQIEASIVKLQPLLNPEGSANQSKLPTRFINLKIFRDFQRL